jgi:hypothetical protein
MVWPKGSLHLVLVSCEAVGIGASSASLKLDCRLRPKGAG